MSQPPPNRSLVSLSVIAVVVGIITGFGSIFFRGMIGFIHNVLFLGLFSVSYDANVYTPASPWGALVILIPVIGGMGVVFLVESFAPEARGHGVPEVMDAIFYKEGRIRPAVAVVKSLASALSIGSGAAVGREGPIIQIGASLGSTFGQLIRMNTWQRITLVAAGAGAGIAATFNTPIGGVLFAIELMLPEVSVRTFLPVALATGTATFVARFFLGLRPAFEMPPLSEVAEHPATLHWGQPRDWPQPGSFAHYTVWKEASSALPIPTYATRSGCSPWESSCTCYCGSQASIMSTESVMQRSRTSCWVALPPRLCSRCCLAASCWRQR
jgi:CIC family chloride channel protein